MAVSEKKQVVLVVEGTTVVGSYWHIILNNYLKNIIRFIRTSNESSSEEDNDDVAESLYNVEFAIVVFNAAAACGSSSSSAWCLHQSMWTNDENCVMNWLSTIDFNSDVAFSNAATAQGLLQALMMFRSSNERSPNDHILKRHCILVATRNHSFSPDVENVVKLLQQSNVFVSALYASQIPTHRATCNVCKVNHPHTGVETVTQCLHHMSLTAEESKSD